jgi:hypothetical protein
MRRELQRIAIGTFTGPAPVYRGRLQNWMTCASPFRRSFRPLAANIKRSEQNGDAPTSGSGSVL